jgi:hypothetical protein
MKFNDVCGAVEAGNPVAVPDSFVDGILKAATKARKDREIGLVQHWRIQAAMRRPRTVSKVYAGVIDEGLAAGLLPGDSDADGFDWDSLLAFIEKLLPLILQIISMF